MLELNIPEVIAEVTEAFTRYERALVANDVAALDMLFWNSTHTLRFGIGENLYGYEAIAAFRNARPPINLKRQLQNTLIVSYGRDLATAAVYDRHDRLAERTRKEIGMSALRSGDVVGEHTVSFASLGERLELTHRAHSRDNFALGALRGARFIATARPGLYSMQDVLGLA